MPRSARRTRAGLLRSVRSSDSAWRAGAGALVLLVLLWSIPITLAVVSWRGAERERSSSTSAPQPAAVIVGSRTGESGQSVDLVEVIGARPVASGRGSGTVTSVDVTEGTKITLGARVLSVDNRPVLALTGPTPLYRDLRLGDDGADVLALRRLLTAAGHLEKGAESPLFDSALEAAVRRLHQAVGGGGDGTFGRDDAIYIPDGFGPVSEVRVSAGDVVDGSWPAIEGAETVRQLTIEAPSDGPRPAKVSEQGSFLLIGDTKVRITSLAPTGSQRKALVQAARSGVERGELTSDTAESGSATSRRLSGAVLQTGDRGTRGVVPSSAVSTSASGTHCVFIRSSGADASADAAPEPVVLADVEVDATGVGQTLVDKALIGKRVLRDPSTLPSQVLDRCG